MIRDWTTSALDLRSEASTWRESFKLFTCVFVCVCVIVCMHVCKCGVCVCVCVCVCECVCVCVCVCVLIIINNVHYYHHFCRVAS